MRAAWALPLVIACSACATRGIFTTAGDFDDYRATRVEPSFELRLAAAQRYLVNHPNGGFRDEVRAWFEHAEDVYYRSKRGSKAGLQAYLDALPEGPHHDDVEARLKDLQARRTELDRAASDVETRLTGPGARARADVRRQLGDWLGRWLDMEVFRRPMSDAKPELLVPFSLSLPRPRCDIVDPPEGRTARKCVKLIELPYEVDGDRVSEPREATLEVTVLEDLWGAPLEVSLSGPDLFLRVEEAYRIKPIAPDAKDERAASVKRAMGIVERAFRAAVSDAKTCEQRATPPAVLRLACDGLQLELFPAASPGADDTITIVPIAAATSR